MRRMTASAGVSEKKGIRLGTIRHDWAGLLAIAIATLRAGFAWLLAPLDYSGARRVEPVAFHASAREQKEA